MQIVIDIPKMAYMVANEIDLDKHSASYPTTYVLYKAVKDGTPLPKGHGRLIDADALLKDRHKAIPVIHVIEAPTVLEADKDEEQKFCDVNTVVADQFKGTNSNWTECHNYEQVSCDVISREAVLNLIKEGMRYETYDLSECISEINQLPSVPSSCNGHCNSCIHWRRWIDTDVTFCELTEHEMLKDDFCSKYESEVSE